MGDIRHVVSVLESSIGIMKRYADLEVKNNIYGNLTGYEQEEFIELSKQVEDARISLLESLSPIEQKTVVSSTKIGGKIIGLLLIPIKLLLPFLFYYE